MKLLTTFEKDTWNDEYACYASQVYGYGEDSLKTEGLQLFVNGEELKEYQILGQYSFDPLAGNKETVTKQTVTVLFNAALDGRTVTLSFELPIVLKTVKPAELVIEETPRVLVPEPGTISVIGGKYSLLWEDGTKEEVSPTVTAGSPNEYGNSVVTIAYGGVTATCKVEVECEHSYTENVILPTCVQEGYTQMVCSICNRKYTKEGSIVEKIAHVIVLLNQVEATCTSVGYSGDKWCTTCEKEIEHGTQISPPAPCI